MFSRAFTALLQHIHHDRGELAIGQQIVGGQRIGAEAADRKNRAIDGQRRNDGIHARAVGQAGIHHGRGLVDPAADLGDNLLDDVHQVMVVFEDHVGLLQHPAALDINHARRY